VIGPLLSLMGSNAGITGAAASAEPTAGLPPSMIGYVVLLLIAVPVVILIITAISAQPRNTRVPILFLASVGILISATIVGFALVGSLLGLVFPK